MLKTQLARSQVIAGLLLTLGLTTTFIAELQAGAGDERLDIYWVDVMGGAATLIVTPAGEATLIDTGMPRERDVSRIVSCLRDVAGLKQIDNLVISHYDLDHYGGAPMLSTRVPIVNLYDNGRFEGMRRDPGEEYFQLRCSRRVVLNPGDHIPLTAKKGSPPLKLKCIATRMQFVDPPEDATKNQEICTASDLRKPDPSENANSMVLILEFGSFRFYDATDLTWNLEAKLVCPYDLIGPIDVYQSTHHGLDRSNNPLVLQTIQPTVSIMNNGPTKGCLPEVFQNLKRTPSIQTMYQLHRNQRPDGVENNTDRACIANWEEGTSGNIIKLSVDPTGATYTVSIPATGHQKSFETTRK